MAAMDSGGSAGGGGPAPFLLKTYEMVDNASSDEIVSWSEGKNSFIVWSPPEFASVLLPTYFKHNNFSSFIRQLNTYGFRKIDPERWEFANDDFVQGKKHLLKNIHRRKPVYSHSLPPGGGDSERAAMEEEIERLTREKTGLEGNLSRFKDQQSTTEFQLKDLDLRLENMEQRQRKMFSFVSRAVQNPVFMDHLLQMSGAMPIDLSEVHKKRRLPGAGEGEAEALQRQISSTTLKPDRLLQRDFSSKLRLGLSSAISDTSIASPRTQSSEEEGFISPQRRQTQPECLSIMPETIELSDSAASGCPKKTPNVQLPWQMRNEDEGDRHISCLLNLTLASSPLQQRESTGEDGHGRKIQNDGSNLAAPAKQTSSAAAPGKPNDKFWEQFLTERPGSSDTEEASSAMKVGSSEEQAEEEREGEKPWRSRREVEGLSL